MLDSANLTRSEGSLVQPYTEALFRRFIADCGLALRYFILKKQGNKTNAAELAQQTLVEALTNLRGHRGEASFSTWVFGITSNIALNHVNRTAQALAAGELRRARDDAAVPAPGLVRGADLAPGAKWSGHTVIPPMAGRRARDHAANPSSANRDGMHRDKTASRPGFLDFGNPFPMESTWRRSCATCCESEAMWPIASPRSGARRAGRGGRRTALALAPVNTP